MNKALKISLIVLGVGTAGLITYRIIKKHKEKKAMEESESSDGGGSTTISDPRVYKGITDAQTKVLQQLLNKFYTSGSLSGLGNSITDWISNQWSNTKNFVKSTVKNTSSLITGKVGVDEFKAKVASIMPLKEDGIYGKNTMAAVKALQEFLNKNGASLVVDGKYGKNTEKSAGWSALAGLGSIASNSIMYSENALPVCGLI